MEQPHDDERLDVRVLADLENYIEDQCKTKWINHMTTDDLLSVSWQIWEITSGTRARSRGQPHENEQLDTHVLADLGNDIDARARSSGSGT